MLTFQIVINEKRKAIEEEVQSMDKPGGRKRGAAEPNVEQHTKKKKKKVSCKPK